MRQNQEKYKAKSVKQHRQGFIARLANRWFDRVMGAMKGEGFSAAEEEYESHRTSRDFIWNTIGSASWAFVFPIVTMVSTQLVGVEQAGMIAMAFVVGLLLMFVGNFGVRTYQISDIGEESSFKDYQVNRWITCILMIVIGAVYCNIRGYGNEMYNISMGVILYRAVDALADVYEGRLQQSDKLYLAGVSQAIRSILALVVFSLALLLTRSPVIACYGMAIAAAITFVAVTFPLTLMETRKSAPFTLRGCMRLFKVCAPLFIAIFMFNVIENMPKFVMEDMLPYDNQLYYNAIYFPAQMVLICAQLVYKPLLLRMAGVWRDASKRLKFDLILIGLLVVIVAITAVGCLVMAWVGIPVMSILYGIDFMQYRGLIFLMLITGGITAAIDFLYQVVTIMRRQKDVTVLYIVTFGFSLFIPFLLIRYAELEGAVLSYVIIESILFVLLVWEYFRIRWDLSRNSGITQENDEGLVEPKGVHLRNANEPSGASDAANQKTERPSFVSLIDMGDPMIDPEVAEEGPEEEPRKPRPSELRAERMRREEIFKRRTRKK